jgi:hypothetical protein
VAARPLYRQAQKLIGPINSGFSLLANEGKEGSKKRLIIPLNPPLKKGDLKHPALKEGLVSIDRKGLGEGEIRFSRYGNLK